MPIAKAVVCGVVLVPANQLTLVTLAPGNPLTVGGFVVTVPVRTGVLPATGAVTVMAMLGEAGF
jgi:hypothetical protein